MKLEIKSLIFVITISFFLTSCEQIKLYVISHNQEEISRIERVDHQFCTSLGLDSGGDNAIGAEIYWRCRIIVANHRISFIPITPNKIRDNIIVDNLMKEIKNNYENSFEKSNYERNSIFNDNDHLRCLNMGNNLDTLDRQEIEDYYICRKKLINEQQIVPPYLNENYFNRGQDTYTIPFSINKNIDDNIAEHEKQKAKYPFCVEYFDKKSEKFPQCTKDFEDQKLCFKKIKKSEILKKMDEMSSCQKQSYLRFPESMLKEEIKRNEEIDNVKIRADIDYSNNLASLGITQDKTEIFKAKTEEEKQKEKKEKLKKNFNSTDELYSRVELGRLRQEFIQLCNEESKKKVKDYVDALTDDCKAMTLKWQDKTKKEVEDEQ